MSSEWILTNARIVTRHEIIKGSVRVVGGAIVEVSAGPSRLRGALDLEGDFLLPGLVELHTDMLEKHAVPRPKVQWPLLASVMAHDAPARRRRHHHGPGWPRGGVRGGHAGAAARPAALRGSGRAAPRTPGSSAPSTSSTCAAR